jgi:uncharacterized protein DUF1552
MSNWRISRRKFITGLGIAFTLPLLESLRPRRARAATPVDPRRFVSLYMPSGTYNIKGDAVWYPPAGALTQNLPLVLSPFAANIGDFSVLMHPSCNARDTTGSKFYQITGRGAGHVSAVTTWLSQTGLTDPNSSLCSVPGSSFDQIVADANKQSVLVMSGGCSSGSVDNTPFDYSNYVSYKNGQPLEPHKNPVDLYKNVFAGLVQTGPSMPPPPAMSAAARNHSILDTAVGDIQDLQSKLGTNDRAKLDDYFSSIRDLETKLYNAGVTVGSGCTGGMLPDASLDNVDQNGDLSATYSARVQAFFDMIVLAFKCDLTRSVSFMYDGDGCQRHFNSAVPPALVYDNVSLTAELHTGISHYGQNDMGREKCITRDRFYLSLMFYLVDKLKGATDASGTPILDNTIILGGFNVVDGNHNDGQEEGVPMVVAGGRSFMHPGNCFDLGGADMKDLFYTFSTLLNLGLTNYMGSTNVLKI